MMKIMMVVIGHGDDQVLELGKEEREKQKAQDKCDIHSSFTAKNPLIHDGLLWSQTCENASQLTHDDDREKRHVFRVIHLLNRNGPSQVGFFIRHG